MKIQVKAWCGNSGRKVGTTEGMKQVTITAETEREAAILSLAMTNICFDAIFLFANMVFGIKSKIIPLDRQRVIESILDQAEGKTLAEIDRREKAMKP